MTKEEHAKVLAALEAITKHFSISRLHESTLADTTVRGQAHEAIAIMRKEPEPINPHHPQYVEGFKAGHAAGRLRGRAEKKEPEPISDAEIDEIVTFARALLEKAR